MANVSLSPAYSSSQPAQLASKNSALKAADFTKLMITQLQNQDPTKPTDNSELLAQVSQISQLQSNTELQTTLKDLTKQNQIGAAGNLIGKTVQGLDGNNDPIEGFVNSVRVEKDGVSLELDNGKTLALGRVTSISPAATPTPASPKAKAA